MKTVAYIRVSTEDQAASGVTLDAQEQRIRQYAGLYDLKLLENVQDAGYSAKCVNRPGIGFAPLSSVSKLAFNFKTLFARTIYIPDMAGENDFTGMTPEERSLYVAALLENRPGGLSLDEIGAVMGLSYERVRQLRDRALHRAARRFRELWGLVAVDRPEGPALTFSRCNNCENED